MFAPNGGSVNTKSTELSGIRFIEVAESFTTTTCPLKLAAVESKWSKIVLALRSKVTKTLASVKTKGTLKRAMFPLPPQKRNSDSFVTRWYRDVKTKAKCPHSCGDATW